MEDIGNAAARVPPSPGSLVLRHPPLHRPPVALGGMVGHPRPEVQQADLLVLLSQSWRVLLGRKGLILSATLGAGALGILNTVLVTPLYTSTVRIQIDRTVAKIVEGGSTAPAETMETDFLRTQYELLLSRAMAERVVAALHLGEDTDFAKPRLPSIASLVQSFHPAHSDERDSTAADPDTTARAATRIVLANRAVRPLTGSRLVDLSYSDPSPARAQAIAGAYADAFIASSLEKRFQSNAYAKTFLDEQIKQLKLRLEASERALLDFAEREQIVIVGEKSSNAESNLAAANAALGGIVSERIRNEQLWAQISVATAINVPQLLSNSVIDGLRARRNALVTEYEEKLETFKPGYPTMLQIKNKIAEIDRQLAAEVKTVKQAFKAAFESSRNQEAELRKRIDALHEEVLDLQKRSIQYNILKREVDTNRSLYESLLQRFKEVDIAGGVGVNNVFVIDRAELPGAPSSPQVARILLVALSLGFGAGFLAAYVLERLDDRIRTPYAAERVSGVPTLGVIPKAADRRRLAMELADPESSHSEAYRALCAALQLSHHAAQPRSLFVTSSGSSEGKSTTALCIARHFAAMGLRVLLVDADLRSPSLHRRLGLGNALGLGDYLADESPPQDVFQGTGIANLTFMAAGPLPANAGDLLAGGRLQALLSAARNVFDLVVFDGPPVLDLADATLLSNAAEATLFVIRANGLRAGTVVEALRRLHTAHGLVVGTVLVMFDERSARHAFEHR